jgi:chromosome segregation ATPase
MARGKNKAIAERRKEAVAEIGSITAQQNTIRNQKNKIEELENKLAEQSALHAKAIAGINYRLTENTSELVEELRGMNESLIEQIGDVRSEYEKIQKNWTKVYTNLKSHFMNNHGMKQLEAIESATALLGDDPNQIITVDIDGNGKSANLTSERLRTLQKVRGLR